MLRGGQAKAASYVDLYLDMLNKQHTYDALRIIHFDTPRMDALVAEMGFTQELARAGKIIQGLVVARTAPARGRRRP